jgi:error-prone DNA polymerase
MTAGAPHNVTPGYVELHCHSALSLLDGASTPEQLVEVAAALGYPALALTDHDELGGVVRFGVAADAAGLGGIIGAELTVAVPDVQAPAGRTHTTRGDATGAPPGTRLTHLVLLAESRDGYGHLSSLITRARMDAPRGRPSVPWALVAEHAHGLTALTGCPRGWVPQLLAEGRDDDAWAAAGTLRDAFGERLAVECWDHRLPEERALVRRLRPLAARLGVPWVVTNNVHYARPEGRAVHDVLTALRHQRTLDDMGTRLRPNAEWTLKDPALVRRRWRGAEEGVDATCAIAERCAFRIAQLKPSLPTFPLPPGVTADEYLARLVEQGAHERWGPALSERQRRQLAHELAMIATLRLAGYFLIVWDIVRFARREGILCQGRGSAANSAVCYCLGITAVDPIRLELLFERFLSTERQEAPDIDIDFAHRDRERVLQYVYRRYGREHAAMVCEQISWRGRSAVRDAARVLGLSVEQADELSVVADRKSAKRTAEQLVASPLATIVAGLDQLPRHRSIHVGGFVLTGEPLGTVVPIEPASMPDRTVIQWEKDDLDPVGLVKIDLLGLGMLTVVQDCLAYIRHTRGVAIDLGRLDMADQAVYDDLCRADTVGLFQVESRAQMNTLPRLEPRCFYDLVVEVALIRPGPIQGEMVHPYLRRRAGTEPVTYPHPSLEPVLRRTLGVPLFQEQGMQVAIAAAGFTPGQADVLRRAMGHKRSHERMAAICEELVAGMARNGIPEDVGRRIYQQINAFADYGFPESHAASFALIVYATAWLRHYYAAEYTAAILNAQPMGFYAPGTLIEDARRHGVEVRPIDLTCSAWDHTMELADGRTLVPHDGTVRWAVRSPVSSSVSNAAPVANRSPDTPTDNRPPGGSPAVRLGLRLVRGLGRKARCALERALADGPFTSVDDAVRRVTLDRAAWRRLAEAGAFDTMFAHEPEARRRRVALWELLAATRGPALPLAPAVPRPVPNAVPTLSPVALTEADYRMTGLSLAGHPMVHLRALLAPNDVRTARDAIERGVDGAPVAVAGLVICRQRPGTAKGFVFLTLEDETGMINVVVRPQDFERHGRLISTAPLLLIRGVLQVEQGVVNVKARRFRALELGAGEAHARSHDYR